MYVLRNADSKSTLPCFGIMRMRDERVEACHEASAVLKHCGIFVNRFGTRLKIRPMKRNVIPFAQHNYESNRPIMNPFSTFFPSPLPDFLRLSPIAMERDGGVDSCRRTCQYFFRCSFLRSRTHALCRIRALTPPDAKVHAHLCVQQARADILSPRAARSPSCSSA